MDTEYEIKYNNNKPLNIGSFRNFNEIPTVYHYTNIDALESIIKHNKLWLSNCKYLNDSEEIKYTKNMIIDLYRNRKQNTKTDNLIEQFINTSNEINNIFTLSTSYDFDNLTLWYNYSNNDGYNIGIDLNNLVNIFNNNTQVNFGIINYNGSPEKIKGVLLYDKVIYDIKQQTDIINMYIDYFESLVSEIDDFNILYIYRTLTIHNLLICSLFLKIVVLKTNLNLELCLIFILVLMLLLNFVLKTVVSFLIAN